jgi:hypothetical protein
VGLNVLNVKDLLVEGCHFTQTTTHAIGLRTDVVDVVIRDNVIHGGSRGNGIYLEDNGQRNITISNNRVVGWPQAGLYLRDNVAGPVAVRNNTFYGNSADDPAYGTVRAYNVTASPPDVVFENNIVYSRGQAAVNIRPGVAADGFRFDHNLWFSEADQRVIWLGDVYSSFQDYQQAGNEPHSLMQVDPLFANTTNFALQADSPAVEAGIGAGIAEIILPKPRLLSPADRKETPPGSFEYTRRAVQGATGYDLRLDGTVYTTSETSMSLVLDAGAHIWSVQALGEGGSASGYTEAWSLTAVSPVVSLPKPVLLTPAAGATVVTANVQFTWGAVAGATAYELQVDGTPHTTTDPFTSLPLDEGSHEWTVQALGEGGLASGYPSLRTFVVDVSSTNWSAQIAALQSMVETLGQQVTALEARMPGAERQITLLEQQIAALDLSAIEQHITTLEQQMAALEQQVPALRGTLCEVLRSAAAQLEGDRAPERDREPPGRHR